MSKTIRENEETQKTPPDLLQNLSAKIMRNIHDENSVEPEGQTQEDMDEGWQKNPSPLAGRMAGSMEELERIQSSEMMETDEVRGCIQDSLECYRVCMETLQRCLSLGGRHAENNHVNLLLDCAKICSLNADFMLRNSTYYPQTCGLTADICDECADTCERFEDDFMKECGRVCRRCGESCREMAR